MRALRFGKGCLEHVERGLLLSSQTGQDVYEVSNWLWALATMVWEVVRQEVRLLLKGVGSAGEAGE